MGSQPYPEALSCPRWKEVHASKQIPGHPRRIDCSEQLSEPFSPGPCILKLEGDQTRTLRVSLATFIWLLRLRHSAHIMRTKLTAQLLRALSLCALLSTPSFAQHAQVSSVAVDPANPDQLWVCNKFNRSVSLIDVSTDQVLAEVRIGHWPRSCALSADGSKLFVEFLLARLGTQSPPNSAR